MPIDLQRAERALRAAHKAGDTEAAQRIAQGIRQMQAGQPQPAGPVEQPAEPGFFERHRDLLVQALAGPMLAIARDPVQYGRNLAGEAAQFGATAGGIALGAPGGIPGMVVGGAVGASAGARARQLLRGDPEPTTGEKALQTGIGAASGLVGGLLSKAFAAKPDVKLSFDMQTKAKQLEQAFRAEAKAAGQAIEGAGFKSPQATALWKNSKVVEQIENALRIARDKPDRIREQFARLAKTGRLMSRLAPEQRALIEDVAHQSTTAGVLRAIGDLRTSFGGAAGAGNIGVGTFVDPFLGTAGAAGQVALGQAGRTIDRALTQRAVGRALQGVSGMPVPPPAPNVPVGALGGAAAAQAFGLAPDYLAGEVYRRTASGGVGPPAPQLDRRVVRR